MYVFWRASFVYFNSELAIFAKRLCSHIIFNALNTKKSESFCIMY